MRHAGVLVMSSEADIGRVSASELFSQQTCKWIPNGLFTYITLARAPPQGPAPPTYQMSINLAAPRQLV